MTESAPDKPHLVLARKYRPQRFDDLVGQEHVVETLRNAITSDRLAHAYLFTGIRGVGKTTAARLLARALNCTKIDKATVDPCENPDADEACANCKDIANSRSIDVAEIDGASNRGIDNVRELNESVRHAPVNSRWRIYIIDEAHMVTKEGFNALLKTLEEPPPRVKFIFATTAVDKFPETILSRCQRYDFKRIPLGKIISELRRIAGEEGVTVAEGALYQVAREAEGSMRDAESLLERLMAFGTEINDARVAEVLGLGDRKTLHEAADAILTGDPRRALEISDRIYQSGWDLERFSRDLLEHWRNLVVTKLHGDRKILDDLPDNEFAELEREATLRPLDDLQGLFQLAHRADEELRRSEHPRLVFEMMIVRLATLEPALGVEEVLTRLDDMARSLGVARPVAESARPAPVARVERPTPAPERSEMRAAELSTPPRPESPAPANGDGDPKASRWEEFLGFLQEKRLSVYMNLSHARPLLEASGRLVLGIAKEFSKKELGRREALSAVEELASEFYGQPTRVSIETLEEPSLGAPAPSRPAELLENPAVKKVVEVFGGEVREIRSRR